MTKSVSYLQRANELRKTGNPSAGNEYLCQQYDDLCLLAASFDRVTEFIKLNKMGLNLFPVFDGSKEGEFIEEMLNINPFKGESIQNPELEYLAQLINVQNSVASGLETGTKWLCLTKELRAKYLHQARTMVESWRLAELDEIKHK